MADNSEEDEIEETKKFLFVQRRPKVEVKSRENGVSVANRNSFGSQIISNPTLTKLLNDKGSSLSRPLPSTANFETNKNFDYEGAINDLSGDPKKWAGTNLQYS